MSLLLLFPGAFLDKGRKGGSGISGGTFSRRRWHDLLKAEEAQRKAQERAERVKEKREREAALRAQAEAKAALEAARAAQDHANAIEADLRALTASLQAQHGAAQVADIIRNAAAVHAAVGQARRQAEQDDEDEALALLLAA